MQAVMCKSWSLPQDMKPSERHVASLLSLLLQSHPEIHSPHCHASRRLSLIQVFFPHASAAASRMCWSATSRSARCAEGRWARRTFLRRPPPLHQSFPRRRPSSSRAQQRGYERRQRGPQVWCVALRWVFLVQGGAIRQWPLFSCPPGHALLKLTTHTLVESNKLAPTLTSHCCHHHTAAILHPITYHTPGGRAHHPPQGQFSR